VIQGDSFAHLQKGVGKEKLSAMEEKASSWKKKLNQRAKENGEERKKRELYVKRDKPSFQRLIAEKETKKGGFQRIYSWKTRTFSKGKKKPKYLKKKTKTSLLRGL